MAAFVVSYKRFTIYAMFNIHRFDYCFYQNIVFPSCDVFDFTFNRFFRKLQNKYYNKLYLTLFFVHLQKVTM